MSFIGNHRDAALSIGIGPMSEKKTSRTEAKCVTCRRFHILEMGHSKLKQSRISPGMGCLELIYTSIGSYREKMYYYIGLISLRQRRSHDFGLEGHPADVSR